MNRPSVLFQVDAHAALPREGAHVVPIRAPIDFRVVARPERSANADDRAMARQHHPLTRILHWTMPVLLIVAVGTILAREWVSDRATARLLLAIHESSGLTVLALTLVRLAWRAFARVGALHAALSLRTRVAAAIGHYAIYATTLALTVLGWLTSNAFGLPVRFFGLLPLPALIARDRDLGDALQDWHVDAAWLLLALVVGHVVAALWHHYIRRDDVLRSMQPHPRRTIAAAPVSLLRPRLSDDTQPPPARPAGAAITQRIVAVKIRSASSRERTP